MVVVVVVPFSLSLENENKTSVIQAILFHDAIGRMKAVFGQKMVPDIQSFALATRKNSGFVAVWWGMQIGENKLSTKI